MATQIDNDSHIYADRKQGYSSPGVIRTSDGTIYVGHYNDSQQLEIHTSGDNGSTWSLDTTFTESNMDYFSFAVSENDDVFIAFCEGTSSPTNIVVKKKDNSSGTWSEILSESVANDAQQPILLYNTTNNRLYLFWAIYGTGIYNKYSDDKGSTWSSSKNIYPYSDIGILYDGDIRPSDGYIVILMQSINDRVSGQIFDLDGTRIGSSISYSNVKYYYGKFIFDLSDNHYMIACNLSNYLNIYKNASQVTSISISGLKIGHLALGVDNDDNVYCLYTKTDKKCYCTKYTSDTDTWESEVTLTSSEGLRPSCEKRPISLSTSLHITYFSD